MVRPIRSHAAGLLAAALCVLVAALAPALADSDLERAYRIIAAKKFVDLTHAFGPETPVWAGFGQAKFSPAADPKTGEPYTIPKDEFRATYYQMVGQYGTHVDPPAHFAQDGITMDKIPLKQMIMRLVVLDDTPYLVKDPNHAFSIADLKVWEREHGPVPNGAFAALRTDMAKDWDSNPERFKRQPFPAWSFETIKYLYERRGVTATGHEIDGHRHHRQDGFGNLDPAARPLPDRGHGQSRQGAADRRAYRGDLAESGKRSRLSRARFRDSAVNGVPDAARMPRRARKANLSSRRVALRSQPGLDLALGFDPGKTVARLQAGDQFAAAAGDARDILVSELCPVVADLALEHHPIHLDLIPVHRMSPC